MTNPMTLVEENMKLVSFVIHEKNLYIPTCLRKDIRDLYQEGYLLLINAANKYDSSLGYKFSTYAVNTIYLGLRSFIDRHSEKRYGYEGYSLENEVYSTSDGNITWKELISFEEEGYEKIALDDIVNKSEIKDIEEIVDMRRRGYEIKEIKDMFSVSRVTIDKKLRKLKCEIKIS